MYWIKFTSWRRIINVIRPFGPSSSISFKIILNTDRADPQVNVLNWDKANIDVINLAKIGWCRLFTGEGTSGMVGFKRVIVRVQGMFLFERRARHVRSKKP